MLSLCAQPDNDASCAAGVAQSRAYLAGGFAANATALFAATRARAPKATLIVVGYPRLFNGTDCSPLVAFSAAEQSLINGTVVTMNQQLEAAARRVGARLAYTTPAVTGPAGAVAGRGSTARPSLPWLRSTQPCWVNCSAMRRWSDDTSCTEPTGSDCAVRCPRRR